MYLELVKQLRATTHAPLALCRAAAQQANGDLHQARLHLEAHWQAPKPKAAGESAGQLISYVHGGKIGVMVDLRCATDFVARTDQFQSLGKELALQVAAGLEDEPLLDQPSIRNPKVRVRELVAQLSRQVGEAITVKRTMRWSLDDE